MADCFHAEDCIQANRCLAGCCSPIQHKVMKITYLRPGRVAAVTHTCHASVEINKATGTFSITGAEVLLEDFADLFRGNGCQVTIEDADVHQA